MSNNNKEKQNPDVQQTKSSNLVKLVTVHGTGAGDITSSGDKWWQLGSVFMQDLQSRLELDPAQVEIVPFQWQDGPNSEEQRRIAGCALGEQLHSFDQAGQDYYLVGHSHGGSVIYNSLLKSVADKKPFERLKLWCTVGTPFLDYRPNTFLFQRLKSLGLTFCTTGIVAITLGVWVLLMMAFKDTVNPQTEAMGYSMTIYGVIVYGLLWLYERRKKTWFTRAQKKQTEQRYGESWCGLWHQEDEAISALSNIKNLSAPIIPNSFLQPIVASLQLILVLIVGAFFAYDLAFNAGVALSAVGDWLVLVENDHNATDYTIMMFILISFFIVTTFIFTKILSIFAYLAGRPLALFLNKIVWSSIKQRAWGDDLLKEDVHEVGSHPPEFPHKFDYLGETIANPLRKYSEKNAIKTLHKVRLVLGMAENANQSADIRSELSESLNWQELIHTSYFDVPEFVDLLARSLQKAGLGELKKT